MADRNYTKERDDAVIPVARKLLTLLAQREDLMMGSSETITPDKAAEYYQKVFAEDFIPLVKEANLKLDELTYLFSIILQPMQLLNDVVTSSFEQNRDIADAFKYGVNDIHDLRVNDLDAALHEGAAAVAKSSTVDKKKGAKK